MIVVTTPTGNVGSVVVQLLQTHQPPLPFRLAAHRPEVLEQKYGSEVHSTKFDFASPETWSETLADVSILFLVCPQPDPRTIKRQILPLIAAAREAGCQHIIYQSVPIADRNSFVPHYRIERCIEASGIPYTFLRPAYFMQNFMRQAPTHDVDIRQYHEIFIPAGRGHISLIDARDVAQAVVCVCERPEHYRNQAFYLAGSPPLSFYEIAQVFTQVLRRPIRYPHPSLLHFCYRLWRRHVPLSLLLVMAVEYTAARFSKAGTLDPTVEQIIGRAPLTLAQFVADYQHSWSV